MNICWFVLSVRSTWCFHCVVNFCQKLKVCVCLCIERHDALYVVGALEEAMELRGMRYHPIDIETSVIRTHKSITEW